HKVLWTKAFKSFRSRIPSRLPVMVGLVLEIVVRWGKSGRLFRIGCPVRRQKISAVGGIEFRGRSARGADRPQKSERSKRSKRKVADVNGLDYVGGFEQTGPA